MIAVQDDLPQTKAVYGSDRTLVSVRKDERSVILLLLRSRITLAKGQRASGAEF